MKVAQISKPGADFEIAERPISEPDAGQGAHQGKSLRHLPQAARGARLLRSQRIEPVHEQDWGESLAIPGFTIHCVPALHFSARGILDRNKTLWCGYVIEYPESLVYFAGDTGFRGQERGHGSDGHGSSEPHSGSNRRDSGAVAAQIELNSRLGPSNISEREEE